MNQPQEPQEVLLLLSIEGLLDQEILEKHLKREGLLSVQGEPFTYIGESTTHKINTVLYLHSAVQRALTKAGFVSCKMIFQIGDYPMEAYRYDREQKGFVPVEL